MFHLGVECATQKEIDQHLTLGMQLLSRGQYSDALSHFHAAVGKSFEALTYVKTYYVILQMPIQTTTCRITKEQRCFWL